MAGEGTDNFQIEKALKGVKGFLGVFAADELPDIKGKGTHLSLIANYSDSDSGGTHWVAFINLNGDGPPLFFDAFGFAPDDENTLLHTDADFVKYLKQISQDTGHSGKYYYSMTELQCTSGDQCGDYSVFCVKTQSLPNEPDGEISIPWRPLLNNMRQHCEKTGKLVEVLSGIKRPKKYPSINHKF